MMKLTWIFFLSSCAVCYGTDSGKSSEEIIDIGLAYDHACVLSKTSVYCAGSDIYGQRARHCGFNQASQLTVGSAFTCVLDNDGVWCWGINGRNQISVPKLERPTKISAGMDVTCAIDQGKVQCWGSNKNGQLDPPENLVGVTDVSVGFWHACAIAQGKIQCWGSNQYGQLNVPKNIADPKWVLAGTTSSCTLHDGGIECWGHAATRWNSGQSPPDNFRPLNVIRSWGSYCGLVGQDLKCWGSKPLPTDFQRGQNLRLIASNRDKLCAVSDHSLVSCVGPSRRGEFNIQGIYGLCE